jgi:hypothetical protein
LSPPPSPTCGVVRQSAVSIRTSPSGKVTPTKFRVIPVLLIGLWLVTLGGCSGFLISLTTGR